MPAESRLTKRHWMLGIFVVAVCIRLVLALAGHVPSYTGEAESIAHTLAESGEFGGAYVIPTGPTAHCGPFYAGLLSLVYRIFGSGSVAVAMT